MQKLMIILFLLISFFLQACDEEMESEVSTINDGLTCFRNPECLDIMIVAHRGGSEYAPENSIPAYEYAIENGAALLEVDIRETSDGKLVIMHDDTTSRTGETSGVISEMTYDEATSVVLNDSAYNDAFPGITVPGFMEVLELIKGRCGIYADMKVGNVELILSYIEEAGVEQDVLLHSSSVEELKICREINPNIPAMYKIDDSLNSKEEVLEDFYYALEQVNMEFVQIDDSRVSIIPDIEDEILAAGVRLSYNILGYDMLSISGNNETAFGQFLDLGGQLLQTDYPHNFNEYLNSLE